MGIRGAANLTAAIALVAGLVGRIASGNTAWDWLFLAGFLYLLVGFFGGWVLRGNEIGYPRADDLRRADDEDEPKASILPPNWPGSA